METSQKTEKNQRPALDKCFFGQKSAFKAQYDKTSKSIYIGVGKKNEDESWSWKNAKIKDTEAAEIIRVIQGNSASVSFYHTFNDSKRQIWVNRKDEQLFVRIDNAGKGISVGEQEVLKILLLEAIRLQFFSSSASF